MAWAATATEIVDAPAAVAAKVERLVTLLRASRRTVVLTGAGVSTDAGIPDFRGDDGIEKNPRPLVTIGVQERELEHTLPTCTFAPIVVPVGRQTLCACARTLSTCQAPSRTCSQQTTALAPCMRQYCTPAMYPSFASHSALALSRYATCSFGPSHGPAALQSRTPH